MIERVHPLSLRGLVHLAGDLAENDDIEGAIEILKQATANHSSEHLPWFIALGALTAYQAVLAGRAKRRRARKPNARKAA